MSGFKTELHCHTIESSICGKVEAKEVVKAYIEAGYSTLVITDHYGERHIGRHGEVDEVEHFLQGYRAAKQAAGGKINIILGMEISLAQHSFNDYLIYGDVEAALSAHPDLYQFDLPEFCDFAHKNNLVVYQAHPFRNKITVVDPAPLDGIEVFNSHPRHDSRNNIASDWAAHFKKRAIAGSDAHQMPDIARSGIIAETEITNEKELLSVLKKEAYSLILL
ncbi:MAG: PHP domain-containing protein [Clostridia bacterium]|nr:PHP domain-containing protein [Clostridia bacterium]